MGPTVCNACNKSYHALDTAYKKIVVSDSQEFSVCADVSASVSMLQAKCTIMENAVYSTTVECLFQIRV